MCHIQCPHKYKCTSHPHKCGTCNRNTGKRDYYKPRKWYDWYHPYWQYPSTYPNNPYWQYTWTTNANSTPTQTTTPLTWT